MDGWMDGEVLIIGKVVGWPGGVPKGLPCVKVRPWSVSPGACFFRLIFERASGAFFFIFDAFWWGFGKPKRRSNSNFGRFSAAFFSSTFGNRFLGDFFSFFLKSNLDFCAHSQCFRGFSQNRRFVKK